MDDGSDSRIWPFFSKLFNLKNDNSLEESIKEACEDGEIKAEELSMLLNVLRLSRKRVQEIMIPRTDIVCAEINDDIPAIASRINESGHSRIPIYKETRDRMQGVIHAKDLLKSLMLEHPMPPTVAEFMREPFFIPETKNILELLHEFRSRKIHMAIALDEYGGTSGLVTFEDVLEEIVGDIEDEYDAPRPEDVLWLDEETVRVSGRTPLEEIEENLGLPLDSPQVETIGGYLCELAGRVPSVGESFSLSGQRAIVKEADAKQIRWIEINLAKPTV